MGPFPQQFPRLRNYCERMEKEREEERGERGERGERRERRERERKGIKTKKGGTFLGGIRKKRGRGDYKNVQKRCVCLEHFSFPVCSSVSLSPHEAKRSPLLRIHHCAQGETPKVPILKQPSLSVARYMVLCTHTHTQNGPARAAGAGLLSI